MKQAIQNMAIDTISNLLKGPEEEGAETGTASTGSTGQETPKSDTEKIVDVIKSLMKDK